MNDRDILIVGGYGVVGLRIAPDLGSDYPGRVVVAGRSLARADNAARGIGHGVRGRKRSGAAAPSRAGAVSDDDGRLAGGQDLRMNSPILSGPEKMTSALSPIIPAGTSAGAPFVGPSSLESVLSRKLRSQNFRFFPSAVATS